MPLIAPASLYGAMKASLPERERDPNKREITLGQGFSWSIFAQGTMDNPTAVAFGPQGELYVADISGSLWVADDKNGDYTADTISSLCSRLSFVGWSGMAMSYTPRVPARSRRCVTQMAMGSPTSDVSSSKAFLYPIDVTTGPDGNLHVAGFGTSAMCRIIYDPNKVW